MNNNKRVVDYDYLKKQIWTNFKIKENINKDKNIIIYLKSKTHTNYTMQSFQTKYFKFIKYFLEKEFCNISVIYFCFEKKSKKGDDFFSAEELQFYYNLKIKIINMFEELTENPNNVSTIQLEKTKGKSMNTIIKNYAVEMNIPYWKKESDI